MTAHTDDDGQAAPLVLVAVVAFSALAMVLVQGGRMGLLDATADTGADAAALAAADVVADELQGPAGFRFLLTGEVPPDTVARATAAAQDYAGANLVGLVDLAVLENGRDDVTVVVRTRSDRELGEPALTEEQRTFRAESRAAARTELSFTEPSGRGCLSQPQVAELADRVGIDSLRHDPSGLSACRGADVRNLAPQLHEAILLVEQESPQQILFSSGFRTYREQADLYNDPTNPYPVAEPGTSWHHTGLAFDASNHETIAATLAAMDDPPLCQPYPTTDEVHFSHADYAECGGPNARPPDVGGLRLSASRPVLVAVP